MPEPSRRPTMADVAAEAGVSRSLVSIVIRGAAGASEETRRQVLAAAQRLDYRPDARARLLRSARSGLLGVVFAVDGAYHAELIEALYPSAAIAGFDVTLSARGPRRPEAEAIRSLLDLGVEALLVIAPTSTPAALAALPVPAVSVLQPQTDDRLPSVATDEPAGIRAAIAHLRELGHARIAHVDGGDAVGAAARRAEYERSLIADGRTPIVVAGGITAADGIVAGRDLLEVWTRASAAERPTAVLVFNDEVALGLHHALRTGGVEIPAGVSLVGFDDSRLAGLAHIDLTSVRQDTERLAAASVEAASAALGGKVDHVLVRPTLTVRGSTACPGTVSVG